MFQTSSLFGAIMSTLFGFVLNGRIANNKSENHHSSTKKEKKIANMFELAEKLCAAKENKIHKTTNLPIYRQAVRPYTAEMLFGPLVR